MRGRRRTGSRLSGPSSLCAAGTFTSNAPPSPCSWRKSKSARDRIAGRRILARQRPRLPCSPGGRSASGPLAPAVERTVAAEGYTLVTAEDALWIIGADPNGALYGVGRLLRNVDWAPGKLRLVATQLTTAPDDSAVATSWATARRRTATTPGRPKCTTSTSASWPSSA